MSANIGGIYAQQFALNIALKLQQKGSKLRGRVMSKTHVGKQASPVDQIGSIAANKVTGRFAAMPRVDATVDRRWVFPTDYDLPQLLDTFDELRLLLDPKSSYVENAMYAMGRAMDDEIIAAFFGTAKTGETAGTSTTFPAGNIIDEDFGGANTGLTVKKLREAKRMLMANQVDLESDPITAIVTSIQHDNLLSEAQIISTDFNEKPVLVEGKVVRFLGIDIIHCERIGLTSEDFRAVPVFAKSGMHLGIWNDIASEVSKRNDLQGTPFQAYAKGTFGATRLEEGKTIKIECVE